jgi:hypothetical protein
MGKTETKWDVCWKLTIKRPEALKMLHSFIVTLNEFPNRNKKYEGEIHGSAFQIWIKTSPLWASAFRARMKGQGTLSEYEGATQLSASFKIGFPYDRAKLSGKTSPILISTFILSWLGILATLMIEQLSDWLLLLFLSSGLVSCSILCAAFIRHYIIDDEFKVFKKEFTEYFKSVLK